MKTLDLELIRDALMDLRNGIESGDTISVYTLQDIDDTLDAVDAMEAARNKVAN